jgi:hypothetical protein
MLDMVIAQIKAIKGGLPDKPETTGALTGFGEINKIDKVETLIKAYSAVKNKEKAYLEAAKEIIPEGIKRPPFKLNGCSGKAWMIDIKARVVIVANQEKLNKLNKVKDKLEANLSAEAKLQKDLADIATILTD